MGVKAGMKAVRDALTRPAKVQVRLLDKQRNFVRMLQIPADELGFRIDVDGVRYEQCRHVGNVKEYAQVV